MSLLAQLKLDITVPDQIVLADKSKVAEENFNLQRMQQHIHADDDLDDDLGGVTDEEDDDDMTISEEVRQKRRKMPANQCNSRSLHFFVKPHYVHGQSLRNISAQEFLVVKSCKTMLSVPQWKQHADTLPQHIVRAKRELTLG